MTDQSRDKTVRFVSQLVRLTQEGKLDWDTEGYSEATSGTAYVTSIEDRTLRLFRYSKEIPNPQYADYVNPALSTTGLINRSTAISLNIFRGEPPKTIWHRGIVLDIIYSGRSAYRFENTAGLSDLYEVASYAAAKVEELMDKVLKGA